MFDFLKKKAPQTQGIKAQLKIGGMHCSSCALTIDDTLEEMDGVFASSTQYARSMTAVTFDEKKTTLSDLEKAVQKLGYSVEK
jgi:copper chaperone CopZ